MNAATQNEVEQAIVNAKDSQEVAEIVAEVEQAEADDAADDAAEAAGDDAGEPEAEETLEDDEQQDDEEPVVAKVARREHEHKPSIAYVEMIVRKREERGGITKAALKTYREDMLRKHGLPVTKKEQTAYVKAQAEAKAARKAEEKATRAAAKAAAKAAA